MTQNNSTTTQSTDLVIERIFNAPRELVYKAWTEPEHMMRWWGPEHFSSPACQIDLRVGGKYLWCMRSPDGHDFWSTGVYTEIVPNERIAYTDCFADEHGNVVPASHYGMGEDFPSENQVIVTFESLSPNQTKMTLRHIGMPSVDNMTEMARQGWNGSFDKLAISLT